MNLTINANNSASQINARELSQPLSNVQKQALPMTNTPIVNDIVKTIAENMNGKGDDVDIHTGVRSEPFFQLVKDTEQVLQSSLNKSGNTETINVALPKNSQQSTLICMLIELANEASLADIELSSAFGIMGEDSYMSAADAQKAQGMAIFARNIVSSSIKTATNGVATHKAVKNYSAAKVNITQNLQGMQQEDLNIRQIQNSLNASKNERMNLADIANSATKATKADGSVVEFQQYGQALSSEHQAVAARNLDEAISNRDRFNAAYVKGEARVRLSTAQNEGQRAIGMAAEGISEGSGTLAHSLEQENETRDRSDAKVMDNAGDMSRQQAQKSQQLLANMMNLLNDLRHSDSDLMGAFANNMKA